MNENHNIIWNKISDLNMGKKIRKKLKKIKIQQIDKEKIVNHQESNSIKIEANNNSKALFINKKRGRRIKNSNDHKAAGIHDKFTDDNLKRKVKTHFHNYIIALLNSKIQYNSQEKLKFGKMKSDITQNITVEYNKNLFEKKIKDIILEVSNKYQNKEINSSCYKYIMDNKEINKEVIELLNMTYKDMYVNYYLNSTKQSFSGKEKDESYERHKEKLGEKFGKDYLTKYINNAESLIYFYNTCKKRKSRKKSDGISNIQPSKENTKQTKNIIDNQSNYQDIDEIERLYLKQNKASTITQTDAKPTCSDSESENKNDY